MKNDSLRQGFVFVFVFFSFLSLSLSLEIRYVTHAYTHPSPRNIRDA